MNAKHRFTLAVGRIILATALGAILSATWFSVIPAPQSNALATDWYFRLLNGRFAPCEDWQNDQVIWKDGNGDEIADPFSYWWSGVVRFWNDASVQSCWHNDEGTASGNLLRPAVDYQGSYYASVEFRILNVDSETIY